MLISSELDYLDLSKLAFEWAESYDTKDWKLLRELLAPSVRLDFRAIQQPLYENLSPEEFVAIISDAKLLGDKRLKTQHLIGGSKWERSSDGTVQAWHQARVAHQRYTDEDLSVVANKGHAHAYVQHLYRKIDGTWKLEGVIPKLGWSEYDLFGTLNPKEEGA
jgi:scytalone dehydratase